MYDSAGLGVTLLPRCLIGPVWRDDRLRVYKLPKTKAHVETTFIRRRAAFATSALVVVRHGAREAPARAKRCNRSSNL